MRTVAEIKKLALIFLFAACSKGTVDVPKPADLRLVIAPEALHTAMHIDKRAIVCAVGPYSSLKMREVSCRYDSAKGTYAADGVLFYDTAVSRHYNVGDAKTVYDAILEGYASGLKTSRWESAPGLLDLGDQHHAAFMITDGRRMGNAFVIRKGTIVMSLIVTGLYYEDPKLVRELLEPIVKEAERQD